MTSVYVLRHPQTTWNAAERYQGRLESLPSAAGRKQVQVMVETFAGQTLDAVYTSPLGRALALARELAGALSVRLCIDQRLTEIGQLPWEGLHVTEIEERYPDLYRQWRERPDQVRFPGGEDLRSVQVRALSVLAGIFRTHPHGSAAIVTHSVVIQALAATALCLDLRYIHRIPVSNASVTTLEGTDVPGHLAGLNWTGPLFRSAARSLASGSSSSGRKADP